MGDEQRGVYRKYLVLRTDGSSEPGKKHDGCSYFVLDLNHDKFAIPALRAYAKACRKTHPDLASDIDDIVRAKPGPRCGCREAHCPHMRIFSGEDPADELRLKMDLDEMRRRRR